MHPRRLAPLAAVALLWAFPAPSSAAVTLGSDLSSQPGGLVTCPSDKGCTYRQHTLPGKPLTSPYDGVAVRWRIRVGNGSDEGTVALRAIRLTSVGRYAGVGVSSNETLPRSAALREFATRIPVAAGDSFGVEIPRDRAIALHRGNDGASGQVFSPKLENQSSIAPPRPASDTHENLEWMYNVDVEPDADRDGFGDESQDLCPTDATRQGACEADLAIAVAESADPVRVGTLLTYTFLVQNPGTNAAENVFLSDPLPSGASFVSASASQGSCTGTSTVTCRLGRLAAGAGALLKVSVRPRRAGTLTNTARVSSDLVDPSAANNSAVASTRVLSGRPCSVRQDGTTKDDVLVGTRFGDRIRGGDGNDRLFGAAGADCLEGGAGNDQLEAGTGRNRLSGGAGRDALNAHNGSYDVVNCGSGRDSAQVDRGDRVIGCERVAVFGRVS